MVEMELQNNGKSLDPAMYHEWNELWGSQSERSPADALKIVAKFVSQERSWSEEASVQQLIVGLQEASDDSGGENAADLTRLWHEALQKGDSTASS
jgi:hypothetical protein